MVIRWGEGQQVNLLVAPAIQAAGIDFDSGLFRLPFGFDFNITKHLFSNVTVVGHQFAVGRELGIVGSKRKERAQV